MFSIFFPNNQSMNVWTHFIPLLCFIHRFIFFCKKLDNPLNPINYPFYVHGMGETNLILTLKTSNKEK